MYQKKYSYLIVICQDFIYYFNSNKDRHFPTNYNPTFEIKLRWWGDI